ncbi:MAG: alpha/beta hydrolase-fold protein [Bryobacteraceae bacterium]|nr:alpha/beta hydrolase-fold protein [Bryobacteraceae bacterium]
MHRNLRGSRAYKYLIAALLVTLLLYYGYSELTRTRGAQKVSFVPAQRNCDTSGPLRYCVYTGGAGVNGDLVYHLHGRNLDEQVWNDDTYFTAMLQAHWQSTGALPPAVVTVSYGPAWLLTPKGAQPASGLLDDFLARLPKIEEKVGRPRRRILLGESMGGLNVLIAGLSAPFQFARVAALCPGVYQDSPFESIGAIKASLERTGASPKIALGIWMMAKRYVGSEEEWRRISPLRLIEKARPAFPALYLSCGLYDPYGNYEGTEQLARAAAERGVNTTWHPLYGGHCAVDIPSLADFLSR